MILTFVQVALHEKWFLQLFDSSLCSLRISVISALNISRDCSYAEIAEKTSSPYKDHFRAKPVQVLL